jgi:hypothetical protein
VSLQLTFLCFKNRGKYSFFLFKFCWHGFFRFRAG